MKDAPMAQAVAAIAVGLIVLSPLNVSLARWSGPQTTSQDCGVNMPKT
jgi:hypothetical protein